MTRHICYGILAFGVALLPAIGQQPQPQPTGQQPPTIDQPSQPPARQQPAKGTADRMERADSDWAMKAAKGGLAEVKLGKLAASKGSSQEVKDFGQKMVDDHGKANDELKEIASKKSISLPADVDAEAQATYDNLSKLDGAAFDKAYMADMVKDHKTDVSEFKRESTKGADPDLKAFAAKTLPIIEGHLSMAQKFRASK